MIVITGPSLDSIRNVSGISTVVKNIIDSNIQHDYRHFIIGKADNQDRNVFYIFRLFLSYIKWTILIATRRTSIIHFNLALNCRSVLRDVFYILIARILLRRLIIHLHGGKFFTDPTAPYWMRLAIKLCLGGNYLKIVLSPIEKKILEERMSIRNIHVLPNSIDTQTYNCEMRKANYDKISLLFMGRIEYNKGIEVVYKALSHLKDTNIPFRFLLAGTGPEEKMYIEKFSRLLGNEFSFMGVVSGNTKLSLLESSDVFLLPSFFEGLPMSLLESMSMGLVPIVTNVGSMGHVVTQLKNGFIIDVNDPDGIFSSIRHLYNNPNLIHELGMNAKRTIRNHFNSEDYLLKLNILYKDEQGC